MGAATTLKRGAATFAHESEIATFYTTRASKFNAVSTSRKWFDPINKAFSF